MTRSFLSATLSVSALVTILIAAPQCRAHCSAEHSDDSPMLAAAQTADAPFDWRVRFDVLQVEDGGVRRLGARSDGLGSLGGGSLGASVDHGIGVLPDSGIGTYRGQGLGALGERRPADPVRQIREPRGRVGHREGAER